MSGSVAQESHQQQEQHVLSGPPLSPEELQGAHLPLAQHLVSRLAAHGDRVLQVVMGEECRADWLLRQAAAELCGMWQSVPGLKEGDTVAVCIGRSSLFAPALLAALCSGAVCAVVNAALPHESLRQVLEELQPVAVLCQPEATEAASAARPAGCPLRVLGTATPVSEPQKLLEKSAAALRADSASPAVAMLTSGTTGRPKVIPIPRRTLALTMRQLARSDAIFGADDIVMFTTGFFWISGTLFTLWAIDTGLKFVGTPEFSPDTILECIERYKPTAVFMPPNQWVSLARHSAEPRLRGALQQVRCCLTGGAALKAEAHQWVEARTGRPLTQWYGQTEAFPLCMALSTTTQPPPPGSVGRVSAGVQAKVSPSEIEGWLLAHPQVVEAVVLGLPHDEDQEHPAAFVVLAAGATVTPQELKELVREKACGSEEKLLHGGVFVVDSIPRVATGKVSRGRLRTALLERVGQAL